MISETEYIVDFDKINAENLRLSVLQENTQSNQGNGAYSGKISQLLSSPFHNSEKGGLGSSSGSSRRNQMILRHVPSPEVMETLSLMKSESKWAKLEDESTFSTTNSNVHSNAYLVVTAQRPYFMLWATKKWSQMMGYLVNDIIAYELSVVFGPQTQNIKKLESLLDAVNEGNPQHMVLPIRRRDGKEFLVSLHMFPIFDSGSMSSEASSPSAMSNHTLSSFQAAAKPAKLSFSGAPLRADYFSSAYAYNNAIADPIKSITNPPSKQPIRKYSNPDSPPAGEDQGLLEETEEEKKDIESNDERKSDSLQDSISLGAVYSSRSMSNTSNSTPLQKSALKNHNPMLTPGIQGHTVLNTMANTSVFNPPPSHLRSSFSGYGNYETSIHSDSTLDEIIMQEQESQLSILHSVMSAGSLQHSDDVSHSSNSSFASPAPHSMYQQFSATNTQQSRISFQHKSHTMKKVAYIVLQFSTPKEGI